MASFIVYGDASGQVTVAAPAVAGSNTITFPAETGTLVTTASTTMPNTIVWDTVVKTSGFTAAIDNGYFCNTTSGAFTVTLPATPTRGDFVVLVDYAGTAATNNITINPNGANINGSSGNATINTNRTGITYTYIDSTQGWLLSSNVYGLASQSYTASYLVVAGGGSGGFSGNTYYKTGAGGAGGYLTGTASLAIGSVYTITVGAGGTSGNNGNDSVLSGSGITTITSIGGGFGGGGTTTNTGNSGGSGGGAMGSSFTLNQINAGGSGTPGQGNAGGRGGFRANSTVSFASGGGGGGAGAAGGDGVLTDATGPGGNGGIGLASSITGTPANYAGGGGGGGFPSGGTGGTGGGGNGGANTTGTAGTANTGGGGGGSAGAGGTFANGGSGVVIISVPTSSYPGTTTGSPTVTTSGSNTILRYTGSGTYTA